MKLVEKLKWQIVSVDTALLKQFPGIVQSKTCETREGINSMYIDLVGLIMRESSYTGYPQKLLSTRFGGIDSKESISKFFPTIGM
jgi:hypothetical protein